MEDLSELKVGDKVIMNYGGWDAIRKVHVIDKITPSGLIGIGKHLFYKNGKERGKYQCLRIEEWTKEKEDEINRIRLEKETNRTCINVFTERMNKLTYEQAVAILKILKGE